MIKGIVDFLIERCLLCYQHTSWAVGGVCCCGHPSSYWKYTEAAGIWCGNKLRPEMYWSFHKLIISSVLWWYGLILLYQPNVHAYFPIGSFIFLSLFFLLGWHGYISTFIWHNLCRPMLIGYCSMWRCILNLFVLHFAHKSLILAMATEWCYVLLKIWYSFVDPCSYLRLFSLVSFYLENLSFYLVTLYLWTMSYNDKGNCWLTYRKVFIVLRNGMVLRSSETLI